MFKELSNPHRLQIYTILAGCCEAGTLCSTEEMMSCCVGDLDDRLDIASSTLSHHLKELNQAGLVNMDRLNLDNTQLSDEGLPHLEGMTKLTFLHLGSTAVSDAGMKYLEPLTALQDLKVTRTAVTAAGVEHLKTKLPNTEVQLKYIEGQ